MPTAVCGRYGLDGEPERVGLQFSLLPLSETRIRPRWNIAPTDLAPIVREGKDGRRLLEARWGFRPAWQTDRKRPAPINARAERAAASPLFKGALAWGRVVVPASHFYEWAAVPGEKAKQPYAIKRYDGRLLAFAGIATPGHGDGPWSYAILTTRPNDLVAQVHDRMPVVLGDDAVDAWLDRRNSAWEVLDLLGPCPEEWLTLYPVSRRVGNVANDDPELARPLAAASPLRPASER